MTAPFASRKPGQPPYYLRTWDPADAARHLALIRKAELMAQRRRPPGKEPKK